MKKALMYVRVSTDIQDYNRQISDITNYCNSNNFTIADDIKEKITGTKKYREFISTLLYYFNNHQHIKYLIVQELTRLGRTFEVPSLLEDLNAIGVCTISIWDNIKTLNDDGSVNINDMEKVGYAATKSIGEVNRLKSRLKDGIRNAAKRGNWHGSAFTPFGYKAEGEKKNKRLVINDDEAEIVRDMYKMMLANIGTSKITRWLNANNKPTRTGKKWHPEVVRNIIKNTVNYGEMVFLGEVSVVPAIITKDIFDRVNEKYKHTKKGKHTSNAYMLESRLIKCGVCGKSFYPSKRKNGENQYKCYTKKLYGAKHCGNVGINIDKLNKIVLFSLIYNEANKKVIEDNINNNGILEKIRNVNTEYETILKEIEKTEKDEEKLIEISLTTSISTDKINAKMDIIKANRNDLNQELKVKKLQLSELEKVKNERKSLVDMFKKVENIDVLKENINKIIQKIEVKPFEDKENYLQITRKNDACIQVDLYTLNNTKPLTYITTKYSSAVFTPEYMKFVENTSDTGTSLRAVNDFEDYFSDTVKVYNE